MTWDQYYPRPQLRRDSFLPLNTGWTLNGRIIRLPWPPQAPLSGFGEVGDELRYETAFTLPEGFLPGGCRLILHFGAVDQVAEVFVNGISVVKHEGGYLPFSADVTDVLREGENALVVEAVDALSTDYPYGKQTKNPHGMWYTPVSGIWQPVWMEAVPADRAIDGLKITPDLTGATVEVATDAEEITLAVPEAGITLVTGDKRVRVDLPEPHLWTPDDPYLYRFTVATDTDRVESYFALRTVSTAEINGHTRLLLNGEPVFLHGVLDQGYFKDGLFLPASPEEYERDVLRMKELGCNTLRKHIKIEPEAFYYACDRLGMLVLQDMVNSGKYHYFRDTIMPYFGFKHRTDTHRPNTAKRKAFFEQHVRDTQIHLYNHPCVVGYTIFNEGWGQYDSDRIYRDCKGFDPSRFYIATSGWFARKESDAESEHVYYRNEVLRSTRPGKFLFLSECGGFTRHTGAPLGHKIYGYGAVDSEEALMAKLRALYDEMVLPSIPNGLCGCIYTQLSDVEGEINGLYTYDRAVRKVPVEPMLAIRADIDKALAAETAGVGAP